MLNMIPTTVFSSDMRSDVWIEHHSHYDEVLKELKEKGGKLAKQYIVDCVGKFAIDKYTDEKMGY